MNGTGMRIAVIWARFGPYHMARLEAAGAFLKTQGCSLIGIEVCRHDRSYAWDLVVGAKDFERLVLFEDRDHQELTRQDIARAVRERLDIVSPDVVAIPGWSSAEAHAAAGWCLRNKRGLVVMSESNAFDAPRSWMKEFLKRYFVRCCDAALAGGNSHQQYLARLGMDSKKVYLGYDVVDNSMFAREAEAVRRKADLVRGEERLPRHFFLTCCRCVEVKNLRSLLDAYGRYRGGAHEPWGLVVCGDGILKAGLQAFASEAHTEGVIWPGFVQLPRLAGFYALADVFVLPSSVEPWGLVVNEAMASGLPVLVSNRCGCARELVEEGRNGFTFDPNDTDVMAVQMLAMASGKFDLGSMGRESTRIVGNWSPQKFAEGLTGAARAALKPAPNKGIAGRIVLSIVS